MWRPVKPLVFIVAMMLGGVLPDTACAAEKPLFAHLADYNTQMVLIGTTLLGICGGLVGVFMLLRKRSLVGDVVGHSALPGIALAFILGELLNPGMGKSVPILLLGALLAGTAGAMTALFIDRYSRIKADAALAIVLSLFYGAGTALLTVVQRVPSGSSAGLKDYLYGKTASIVAADLWVFVIATLILTITTAVLFKELCLLCFDEGFAKATGWPVLFLDGLLTALVVGVTIIGMQSVGLLLVVAILIIPPAAARFWTENLQRMTLISAVCGGLSAICGTIMSALYARVAAGAVIVLAGTVCFIISLLFGTRRGIVWKWLQHRKLQNRVGLHDLLRAVYEYIEQHTTVTELTDAALMRHSVTSDQLLTMRSWDRSRIQRLLHQAVQNEYLVHLMGTVEAGQQLLYHLTPDGAVLARRAVRNHRLWEMYLITYADIAPSHVHRDADQIEHVLEPHVIRELELRLSEEEAHTMPQSPHDPI